MDTKEECKKTSKEILEQLFQLLTFILWKRSAFYSQGSGVKLKHIPSVIPVSSEEFMTTLDFAKVHEVMLQETKVVEREVIEVLPDIHISGGSANMSSKGTTSALENKANQIKRMESKQTETDEREIPDIRVCNQASVTTAFPQHFVGEGNNYFTKAMDVPNVLQACQNYDFRFQRELLKTGVTLNLNPDDYLEQTVGDDDAAFRLACAKYLKNYHTDHRQQIPKGQHCRESQEQAATRRAQNALRMRNYRQTLRSLESEQQAAERRAQNALRMRNYRKFKRELEPELAAERRAQNAERMRNYRKVKRELDPEKAARRRAQNALRMRNYRKNKRLQESE